MNKIPCVMVEIDDFLKLVRKAQGSHLTEHEPIPALSPYHVGRVESCLMTPFQTMFGKELYPAFTKKAAMMFYLLIRNHPLENGNKRMGILTLAFFCEINDKNLKIEEELFYNLAKFTASWPDQEFVMFVVESVVGKYAKPKRHR